MSTPYLTLWLVREEDKTIIATAWTEEDAVAILREYVTDLYDEPEDSQAWQATYDTYEILDILVARPDAHQA